MEGSRRISIVTSSDDGRSVIETVESVTRQDYGNVEHIVIDGHPPDGTLARFPHLKVVSKQASGGRADAVNTGFRLATGDIYGLLGPGETLLPGALSRVAREIDPARERHVIMGRCRVVDERGQFVGIEHPSEIESRSRMLVIWHGHTMLAPGVFWTAEAWRTCGPMDQRLRWEWSIHDLFCRFSRSYRFDLVDQVLAAYRLDTEARAGSSPDAGHIKYGLAVSRRYWGAPLSPLYWGLALSLAWFRLNRVGRARHHLRRAQECWPRGQEFRAVFHAALAGLLAPEVVFFVGAYPRLRDGTAATRRKFIERMGDRRTLSPEPPDHLEGDQAWSDGWVGPRLALTREIRRPAEAVRVTGWADLQYIDRPQVLSVSVDGRVVGRHPVRRAGDFIARIRLPEPLPPGTHTVDIEASAWFVPDRHTRNGDLRPLAWRLGEVTLDTATNG
jgi:glycosyltransferase involved in cell wall biosynthesis